jgi:hypothetical protein
MLTYNPCDGAGACGMNTMVACPSGSCNGAACSCSMPGATGCPPGFYCGFNQCLPLEPSGGQCFSGLQCVSGTCTANSCQ